MKFATCIEELRNEWFPHVTDAGIDRIIELLDKCSPLLVRGVFTKAIPMGCLATHIGWHHPETCHWTMEAGIMWLSRIAGLNPATSAVIREWDSSEPHDWEFSRELLEAFKNERQRRLQAGHECEIVPACEGALV
jgi:hypothetical protein